MWAGGRELWYEDVSRVGQPGDDVYGNRQANYAIVRAVLYLLLLYATTL